jgi:hypothetical protein
MSPDPIASDTLHQARTSIAAHLADLHRLHIALVDDARAMKGFAFDGRALAEFQLASDLLEQYLADSSAFLENMHGRFEARLLLLRRAVPVAAGNAEDTVGHAEFWLAFSRLSALLRRVARGAEV